MCFRTCQENATGENPISLKWTVTFTEWNISLCWRKRCEAEQNTAQSCLAADNQQQYHWAAETQGKMTRGSLEQFHDMSNGCHCLASVPFKDGERNYNLESTLNHSAWNGDSGRAWLTECNYSTTVWVAGDKGFLSFHMVLKEKSAYSRLPLHLMTSTSPTSQWRNRQLLLTQSSAPEVHFKKIERKYLPSSAMLWAHCLGSNERKTSNAGRFILFP